LGRSFRPDFVLARNPSGIHAARLIGAVGIFDTDDGAAGGNVFRLAAPVASIITTPSCITENFGSKHVRYPGYKALAFLHPDHFKPDATVRDMLGVGTEPYVIVRVTAMEAAHDHNEIGVTPEILDEIVGRLEPHARVFLTCEGGIPARYRHLTYSLAPELMHDAMAYASLVVGDSGSMVGEAAVLGTPAVFFGSFARRREYLPDLEARWGLARTFEPHDADEMLSTISALAAAPTNRARWQERRARMLAHTVDVSAWYFNMLITVSSAGLRATRAAATADAGL
jgi:predicted glycosyltransferase